MSSPLHGFIDYKDLSFHYLVWNESNEKDALLLVHDPEANARMFNLWANYLASQYQHRVISIDLRGRGESVKHGPFSLELYTEDIERILNSLNIDRVIFIGSSFGATIGLKFTAKYPNRIVKLILVDGGAIPTSEAEKIDYLKSLKVATAHVGVSYPSLDAYWQYWKNSSLFNSVWGADIEEYLKANIEVSSNGKVKTRISKEAVDHDLAEITKINYPELYVGVKCPALLVCSSQGINNNIGPLLTTDMAKRITSSLIGCKLYTVKGANHYTTIFGRRYKLMEEINNFVG